MNDNVNVFDAISKTAVASFDYTIPTKKKYQDV